MPVQLYGIVCQHPSGILGLNKHCILLKALKTHFLPRSAVLQLHVVRPSNRLSVRPSVTLVDQDHIGWKASKLHGHLAQPNTFALRSPKAIHLLPEEHAEIMGHRAVIFAIAHFSCYVVTLQACRTLRPMCP